MILRLLRASIRPQDVPGVLEALRAESELVRTWPGLLAWTHGVRSAGDVVRGVTVSAWGDYDAVLRVADGRPEGDVSTISRTGLLHEVRAEHYELTEPADPDPRTLGGEAIGIVWGRIRPNVEAGVHEMVRAIRPTVAAAGVQALYVGRRVVERRTEICVVAVWRDRLSLHEFARTRPGGAIDPAFTSQLDSWFFETYDSLPPERLAGVPSGPAVVVVDDAGRCVDATPAVEGALGIPGEILLAHDLRDVLDAPSRDSLDRTLTSAARSSRLRLRIEPWPGRVVELDAELEADVPRPGLHSLTLEQPAPREAEAGTTVGV